MRARFSTAAAAPVLGLTVLGFSSLSLAQLVVGNDQTSPTIWLIDITGASPNRALVTGTQATTWGLAADDAHKTLWWNNGGQLFKAQYAPGPLTPVNVGSMTVGGSSMNVTGMAYNSTNNVLYGYRSVTAPGFYSIDQTTVNCTLVAATPASTDFGGFDFDPITNAFYALNDSTGLSGRGLYRITGLETGTPVYTFLTPYPGNDTDIDGLAIGNGRAYMVNDNSTAGQGIYVFNLATNAYETPVANPFSGTNGIFSGGAWAPGLIPEPASLALAAAWAAGLLLRRR
jgi:hypothetical protein